MTATADTLTKKPGRRPIRFETIDQALAEGRRIAQLEADGAASYAGNWTCGQILNHLGAWAEFAYTPSPLKVPWLLKLFVKPLRSRLLNKGLPAGGRVPKVPGGTLETERVSAAEGLARFEKAFARLKTDPPTQPSPLFGTMTHDEYIKLHLRHAELHMSFVQ
jgi:hypothetical protein